jgi:hypothetical protein
LPPAGRAFRAAHLDERAVWRNILAQGAFGRCSFGRRCDGERDTRSRILEQFSEERLELDVREEPLARLVIGCKAHRQDLRRVTLPDAAALGELERCAQSNELFRDGVLRYMPARAPRPADVARLVQFRSTRRHRPLAAPLRDVAVHVGR